MTTEAEPSHFPARYPTTIWSEVERAGGVEDDAGLTALEGLLQKYYSPLQAHLRFRFNITEDQAADRLQDFVHSKVLLGELLSKASAERGRFRTFLLSALDRFVISALRREGAQRRRPARGVRSLEEVLPAELASLAQPDEDPFVERWAETIIHDTLQRMEADCQAAGQIAHWEVFRARVLEPILHGGTPAGYQMLVTRLKFESPAQASNALTTAKRIFRRHLEEVVAEYAGHDADVQQELRDLRTVLAQKTTCWDAGFDKKTGSTSMETNSGGE